MRVYLLLIAVAVLILVGCGGGCIYCPCQPCGPRACGPCAPPCGFPPTCGPAASCIPGNYCLPTHPHSYSEIMHPAISPDGHPFLYPQSGLKEVLTTPPAGP